MVYVDTSLAVTVAEFSQHSLAFINEISLSPPRLAGHQDSLATQAISWNLPTSTPHFGDESLHSRLKRRSPGRSHSFSSRSSSGDCTAVGRVSSRSFWQPHTTVKATTIILLAAVAAIRSPSRCIAVA